jgi:hypothetical protein
MTVGELMEELKKFHEDLEVLTYTGKYAEQPITEVTLEKGWRGEVEDVVFIEGNL